jgi:8-amino-7-oxononanoate synthase
LRHLAAELDELKRRGLFRDPEPGPAPETTFASNDYLGLAGRPVGPSAAGAGASRLIAGEHEVHRRTEKAFAHWLGTEDALLFTSGYAANVGAVSALAGPDDVIVSDALNHASLIDGARLSRARVVIVPHGQVEAVREALANEGASRRRWVLVESYYSMDADGPDLGELRSVCDAADAALFVDEAHALGVLGPGGRGRCAEAGIRPDVLVGTLGKAFGGQGAFVAGSPDLRAWLWNRARSFVFSTGLAPVSTAAALEALDVVEADPDRGARVLELAGRFRTALGAPVDGTTVLGFGQIVPIVVGTEDRAVRLSELLAEAGYAIAPIRPPTVPDGASRIRITITAAHTRADVDGLASAVAAALRRL